MSIMTVIAARRRLTADITLGAHDTKVSAADSAAFTFTMSAGAFGTENTTRKIVFLVSGHHHIEGGITSVKVTPNGESQITATKIVESVSRGPCGIFVADVPLGTTGDVEVVFDNSQFRAGVTVVPMYGASDTIPTGANIDSLTASTSNVFTMTIDVAAGGVGFAVATSNNARTFSWTGLTELDEVDMEDGPIATAKDTFASAQSPLSVVATISGAANIKGAAACAFAKA